MRAVRVFAWSSALVATLLVGVVLALWLGGGPLVGRLAARLAATAGWQVQFTSIAVSWGNPIRLTADNVSIAPRTAQDGAEPFRAKRIEAELDAVALLRLAVRVRRLTLDQPLIVVETEAGEHTRWRHLPDTFAETREIELRDARLDYRNRSTGAAATLEIAEMRAERAAPDGDALRIAGRGAFEGKPFVVSWAELARELLDDNRGSDRSPRPVRLEGYLGANRVVMDGTVVDLFKLQGLDVRVDMAGDDLQQVLATLSVPIPRLPIYLLAGRLQHEIGRWQIEDMAGRIGDSQLGGSIRVESNESGPPYIRADLISEQLDLADLRGLYGGEPGRAGATAPRRRRASAGSDGRIIPDFEIPVAALTGFTADLSLDARRVKPPAGWGIEQLAFALSVKDGGLRIERLRLGTAGGGELIGEAELRAEKDTPDLSLVLEARHVALRLLFQRADVPPSLKELDGMFGGSARLRSAGATKRHLLAGLHGEIGLFLQNGQLTHRLPGLVEGDVGDAFETLFGGRPSDAARQAGGHRINCLIAKFQVADGIATASPILLDTPETIVLGRGNINIADETITLEIRPYAKDGSRRPIGVPLHITGTFADPKITVDKAGFAARVGAALGLGAVEVSPDLKALLSAGPGDSSACAAPLAGTAGANSQPRPAPPRASPPRPPRSPSR
jgi:uncharacterized protein involved in outer membrane biogenesis